MILAPTSSVFPLKELAFEHRMYLPSAAVIAIFVIFMDRVFYYRPALRYFGMGFFCVLVVIPGYLTFLRNKDYYSPLVMWQDVVSHRPGDVAAYVNIGTALTQSGEFEAAYQYFDKAIRLDPDFSLAYFNLGNLFVIQGQWDDALDILNKTLELNPGYAKAHNSIGYVLMQQELFEESVEHFAEAVRLEPDYEMPHRNWGIALFRMGNRLAAKEHFLEAARLNPQFEAALEEFESSLIME